MKRILGAVCVNCSSPMDGLWLELERRHDVLLWGPGRPGHEPRRQLETLGAFDLVLLCDPYRGDSEKWEVVGLSSPAVYVFTDTDRRFRERVDRISRMKPKMLLLRVKDDVEKFREALPDQRVEWLPFGFNPRVFHDWGEPKQYDVAMFGVRNPERYPTREKARRLLAKEFGTRFMDFTSDKRDWPSGVTYARRINRCRVAVVTGGIPGFVVQKYYEMPACRAAMVAQRVENGLGELFEEGKEYCGFASDCSDLLVKVRKLLDHPGFCREVADAGYRRAHLCHTDADRADELERMLGWR